MTNYDAQRINRIKKILAPEKAPPRGSLDQDYDRSGPSKRPARTSEETKRLLVRPSVIKQRHESQEAPPQHPQNRKAPGRQSTDRTTREDLERRRAEMEEKMEKAHKEHLSNKFMKMERNTKDEVDIDNRAAWGFLNPDKSDAHWEAIHQKRIQRQEERARSMVEAARRKSSSKHKLATDEPFRTKSSHVKLVYTSKRKPSKPTAKKESSSTLVSSAVIPSAIVLRKPSTRKISGAGGARGGEGGGGSTGAGGKNEVVLKKKGVSQDEPPPDVTYSRRLRLTRGEITLGKDSMEVVDDSRLNKMRGLRKLTK